MLAPVAFQMFERAPKGGRMMTAFETIETRKKVETMQGYFGTHRRRAGVVRLEVVPALRARARLARRSPSASPTSRRSNRRWVSILNDMTPMIGAMSDNVDNYQAVRGAPAVPAISLVLRHHPAC